MAAPDDGINSNDGALRMDEVLEEAGMNLLYSSGDNFDRTSIAFSFRNVDDSLAISSHLPLQHDSHTAARLHFEWQDDSSAEFRVWANLGHGFAFVGSFVAAGPTFETNLWINNHQSKAPLRVMIYSNATHVAMRTIKEPSNDDLPTKEILFVAHEKKVYTCTLSESHGKIKTSRTADATGRFSVLTVTWDVALDDQRFAVWVKVNGRWSFISVLHTNDALKTSLVINIHPNYPLRAKLHPLSANFPGWMYN
jgi:hypothetical protein